MNTSSLAPFLVALTTTLVAARAASPSEEAAPAEARDGRLGTLVNLRESYFPFHPPQSVEQWTARARDVRTQILVAAGLWPESQRPTPRATIHGLVDRDEYTVERVFLESFPGHFVTGSLYRPKSPLPQGGRRPAVLSPYGHWPGGRFGDLGAEEVAKQIAAGAEVFPIGGRHPLQARCVQLARMGCVVFLFDMEGYCDSQQIPEAVSHRIAATRPDLDRAVDWGFFSTQAELRLQSIFGLQAYNSLCALDWLMTLDDVDSQRIGVTGASGGATQTMMLCATDPRPAVAFEAVMVSTAMQGGCPCENACCLRVGTSNVEFASLMAPKPVGMASANDWTAKFHDLGYPEMQQLYRLLEKPDNVWLAKLTQFPHNYNSVTRSAMYEWFNKHLRLGVPSPIVERDYQPLALAEATVWDDAHPQPAGGPRHEVALVKAWTERDRRQLESLAPRDVATLAPYQDMMRGAVRAILGPAPAANDCRLEPGDEETAANGRVWRRCVVRDRLRGARLPVTIVRPKNATEQMVVFASNRGKLALGTVAGGASTPVERLLAAGTTVVGVDVYETGDCTAGAKPAESNRTVGGDRDLAAYTYGYNRPMLAKRAADLASVAVAIQQENAANRPPALLADATAAPWAAAAIAMHPAAFSTAAIDTAGFRFVNLTDWRDADFLPGAVKYGDLPGLLSMAAPMHLLLASETPANSQLVNTTYAAAKQQQRLTFLRDDGNSPEQMTVRLAEALLQQIDGSDDGR